MPFKDRRFCSTAFDLIAEQKLFSGVSRLLLAVSGGLDSLVLLHFLQRFGARKYGLELAVAHLDHGLRPDSAAVAAAVYAQVQELGLPVFVTRREIPSRLGQSSWEERARQVRSSWLQEVAAAEQFDAIATGHHATDQLETVLLRWVRGSVRGLGGMRARQTWAQGVPVLRPLLALPRADLEAYAHVHKLVWHEDSTNHDLRFTRNRFRTQILPLLRAENPLLEVDSVAWGEVIQAESDYLEAEATAHFHKLVSCQSGRITLPVAELQALHPALQRRLLRLALAAWLQGDWRIFTRAHIDAMRGLLQAPTGKYLELPLGLRVIRERRLLVLGVLDI
jgi:tRNA(Ile)-lysidine synthase